MITPADEPFLRRALRLAMNGRGHVEPNPMVGCVLVKNGQIVGEGWHRKVGEAHAEPNALADCRARGNDPAGATAYVTLEPCCHTNKRTPPCAPRLIEARVRRVVIGCLDPNPDVNGRGVAMLRDTGITVDALPDALSPVPGGEGWGEGVIARGSKATSTRPAATPSPPPSPPGTGARELNALHFRQLIAPFILRQRGLRPYVTLKWAESADGKVAGRGGERRQISNALASAFVHQLRARSDAIIVGIGTVLTDDPLLTARGAPAARPLKRVVLDSTLRIPLDARLVQTARETPTLVFCYGIHATSDKADQLRAAGVTVADLDPVDLSKHNGDQRMSLTEMLVVFTWGGPVLVEPGPTLARTLLDQGLCDSLLLIRSPTSLDEADAPRAATVPTHFVPTGTLDLAGDCLTEYLNTRSPAFFAAIPSADFVLAQESVARDA